MSMKLFFLIFAVSVLFIFSCKDDHQESNHDVPLNSIYMILSKGDTLKFDAHYVDFSGLDSLLLDSIRIGDTVLGSPFLDSLINSSVNFVGIEGSLEPCLGYVIDTVGGHYEIHPCVSDSIEKSLSIFWDNTKSSHHPEVLGIYHELQYGVVDRTKIKSYHFRNGEAVLTENSSDKISGYLGHLQLTDFLKSDSIQVEQILFNVSKVSFLKSFSRNR